MRPLAALRGRLRDRSHAGPRPGLTAVLLVFSVITTALLAVQGHSAYVYHRVTAERMLHDFAGLAGHELARRATSRLGFEGYYPLLTVAAQRLEPEGLPHGLAAALAADPDARLRAAAPLARRFFVAASRHEAPAFIPDPPPPATQAWLRQRLADGLPREQAFSVVHGLIGGRPSSFVVVALREPGPWELVGFEVDLAALGPWFAAALESGPLLPPSVGQGGVTNETLWLTVRDHGGVERFRSVPVSPALPEPRLTALVPFGDDYSGVLAGSNVEVALGPQAARALVVGGLPRSRLPLLLGLLALSTGLVATALLQLRRERALARLRAEFVASVSHELRTPLTQIRMFAETLLLERVRGPEERRRALEILDREARRLTQLVENVMLFSRAERGVVELTPERQPLAPLVREVLEQLAPVAQGAGVRVSAALDGEAIAEVDADALRQVLLNLLDNAVKYGPRGQEVRVQLLAAGGVVRLVVEDEGPGVPADQRRRVFARYQRLERDRRSAVAGMGIGLAVVEELVTRLAGRAWVEDGARGGARFVVELPA